MRSRSQTARSGIAWLVPWLAACAAPPDVATPPSAARPEPTRAAVRRALPDGAVLRLRTAEIAVPGPAIDRGFVDALLREALRLSTRFDVAADLEDGPSRYTLTPTIDAVAGQVALTLHEDDGVPLPLAAVVVGSDGVPAAIDRLALDARRALGETADAPPPPIAELYSASVECVRATERALAQESRGGSSASKDLVARARESDPGCTLALNALASWQLASGRAGEAARTANQALVTFQRRLSPTTAHRLARILLLARARAGDARDAQRFDEQLHELGAAFLADRPHDPHGLYTRALAANYLGRFDEAARDLDVLRVRWPEVPWIPYHLAFARLGARDPRGALEAIEAAARRLPPETVLLPTALALYGSGENGELTELLQRAAARDVEGSPLRHELLRMLAAHAILTGRRDDAVRALLEDLEWLRQRPSVLEERSLDVAEAGEVLVRLGASDALGSPLAALRDVPTLGSSVNLALAFVEGLSAATNGRADVATVARATLERAQRDSWASRVRAEIAHRSGDVATEARELATAIRLDDEPLCRAAFARALRAIGRREDSEALLAETRERLLRIRLRLPLEHPLLGPGRALAFLATEEPGR